MSNLLSIIVTVFDILWLSAVLVLLWLIWRNSSNHARMMAQTIAKTEQTLIDIARMDAESSRRAVDSMQSLVTIMQKAHP